MSLEERLTTFSTKHELDTDAVAELLSIWNATLVDVAHGLLKDTSVREPKVFKTSEKKWASKAASEFAAEHDTTLDDFTKEKITKKDVEEYLKTKEKKPTKGKNANIKCHGLTKRGEPCNRSGSHKPDGAKNNYCFRHAEAFRDFELSSDSSDDEDLSEEKVVENNE